jgi:phosphoribosylformylglycinamidine (FGAM) synthase-like amidotransferase family enzyme
LFTFHRPGVSIIYNRISAYKTNYKGIKNNTSFGQITGIQEKLDTTINRMPHNRLPRVMKHYCPTGRRNYGRRLKDFWIRETRMGQQVAQLHDRYMMMMKISVT